MRSIRFCTLVTDWVQFEAMKASAHGAGFAGNVVFDAFDNTASNVYEPYSLITAAVAETTQDLLIVVHQDVRFDRDDRAALEDSVRQLPKDWAVAGPAGVTDDYGFVVTITDDGHDPQRVPYREIEPVVSLDECLLIFKPRSGLTASPLLSGFHLYGTDLVLRARTSGRGAYVLKFDVRHLSLGKFDKQFTAAVEQFKNVWRRRFLLFYVLRGGEMCLARWAFVAHLGTRVTVRRTVLGSKTARAALRVQLKVGPRSGRY